jgi:hypothetical protein
MLRALTSTKLLLLPFLAVHGNLLRALAQQSQENVQQSVLQAFAPAFINCRFLLRTCTPMAYYICYQCYL